MVQKHGPNKNGDGWIPERIFISMPVQSGGGRREGLPSAEVMQDAMDGMVAGNKSSAANSNNGRRSAKGRESEGAQAREKRASFRLLSSAQQHHQPAPSDHIENPRKAAYISQPHK